MLRTLQRDCVRPFVDGRRPRQAGGWLGGGVGGWEVQGLANTKGISSRLKTVENRSTLLCHLTPGAQY